VYVSVLNADLDKQKCLMVALGADPKSVDDLRYDEPGESGRQVASIDDLRSIGFGTNNRFKKR
jgi:hypothetical protein